MITCRARRQPRRGAIVFLVTFCVLFMLIFSAFVINLAYIGLVDTELRSATDAAARAATETLLLGGDLDDARASARQVALANRVAGSGLQLADDDILFGFSDAATIGRSTFVENHDTVNSVKVVGSRQSGSMGGEVALIFQGFLSDKTFETRRVGTARLMDRDFCLVLDRSGSMNSRDAGTDGSGGKKLSRMEALQIATQTFVDVLIETKGHEQLGATSYSNKGFIDRELSYDYAQIVSDVNDYRPNGMTNIGEGIDDAVTVLSDPNTRRVIARPVMVVMTDGVHNQSRDPEEAARDAMAAMPNLIIHAVTFSDQADVSRMQRVAAIGKGRHHHARDLNELRDVFADIARTAGVTMVE